jgi:4-hydroxy-tetrahydrodipicolinate reductase
MRSLQAVIEHPQYDLVGVCVYSNAKAGRDAGELCGTAPTGVVTTSKIDDILAADPDCVLYMPKSDGVDVDDVCRMLESGVNIVTIVTGFHSPGGLAPDVRRRVEDACLRGGTSVFATGPGMGWTSEVLPLTLTALQRRLDRLTIDQFSDMASRNSPEMLGQLFGMDPVGFDADRHAAHLARGYGAPLRHVAAALSAPIDDITATSSVAVATTTVELPVATIPAGSVAAQRFEITGVRNGKPFLVFRPVYYVTRKLEPAWDLRDTGWRG